MKNGLFLLLCTLALAACGSKGGDNNNNQNGTVATTALDACFNGTAPAGTNCSNVNYSNYSRYGFYNYGLRGGGVQPGYWANSGYYNFSRSRYSPQTYGLSNYAAFCSCQPGTRPVFIPQGGLGCLSSTYFSANVMYYSMGSTNQFTLNTQFNNFQAYNLNNNRSCYQAVASACHIGSAECGGGAVCSPTTSGSPLGICINNSQPGYGYGGGHHHRGRHHRGGYSSTGSISGGGIR